MTDKIICFHLRLNAKSENDEFAHRDLKTKPRVRETMTMIILQRKSQMVKTLWLNWKIFLKSLKIIKLDLTVYQKFKFESWLIEITKQCRFPIHFQQLPKPFLLHVHPIKRLWNNLKNFLIFILSLSNILNQHFYV